MILEFKRAIVAALEKAAQESANAVMSGNLRTLEGLREKIGEHRAMKRAADIVNETFKTFT